MDDLFKVIGDVGFPMADSAYLLIRLENKMDKLTSSINQLSTILPIRLYGNDGNNTA